MAQLQGHPPQPVDGRNLPSSAAACRCCPGTHRANQHGSSVGFRAVGSSHWFPGYHRRARGPSLCAPPKLRKGWRRGPRSPLSRNRGSCSPAQPPPCLLPALHCPFHTPAAWCWHFADRAGREGGLTDRLTVFSGCQGKVPCREQGRSSAQGARAGLSLVKPK